MSKNVEFPPTEDPNILLIRVNLRERFGKSSTGKTYVVGSTEGFIKHRVGDKDYLLNLNVNVKE